MNDLGYKDIKAYVRALVSEGLEKQTEDEDGSERPLEETLPEVPGAETDRAARHKSR